MRLILSIPVVLCTVMFASAEAEENIVADGIPAVPLELRAEVGRYLEFRSASFHEMGTHWSPTRFIG